EPRPLPVVKPLRSAASTSAMPGPASSKIVDIRKPFLSRVSSIVAVPPPPCRTVLRASSLAAVTNFVISVGFADARVRRSVSARLTRVMSCWARRTMVSEASSCIDRDRSEGASDQFEPPIHIQCGLYPLQPHPQLDQSDSDRRPHAHEDAIGVEEAGHARDAGRHPA